MAATRWDVPVTPRRGGGGGGRGDGRSLAALRRENADLGAQLEEARAQLRQLARAAPLDGSAGAGGDGGGDGDIVLVVRQAREREEARGGGEADARRMQRTAGGNSAAGGGGGAAGLSVSALHSRDEAFAQWTREFERGAELQGALQAGCSTAAFAAL